MSVYYEALRTGRLTRDDIANNGGSFRRALRMVKREEAEERNAQTPLPARKSYRRQLAADLAARALARRQAAGLTQSSAKKRKAASK